MGTFYRSQHELVFVFKDGTRRTSTTSSSASTAATGPTSGTTPGSIRFGAGRLEELRLHPTVKPVQLVADAILDASKRRGVVLDPFSAAAPR